jgi:hypothetical protein
MYINYTAECLKDKAYLRPFEELQVNSNPPQGEQIVEVKCSETPHLRQKPSEFFHICRREHCYRL